MAASKPSSVSPNKKIEHITRIQAPIETIWSALIDVHDWSWNKWTKLEIEASQQPKEEMQGKLRASYEGNDEWETFDFTFGEIVSGPKEYVLTWRGSVGPSGCLFRGNHSIRLVEENANHTNGMKWTKLVHLEHFGGILPALGLGLPYETLDRNYLLMNEALKEFVEGKNKEEGP
mmetsp:Transcript_18795/g.54121  ORF Transcript_18795/g.54121 Transcript_18795/m.54121 type:complete len:175 (+) Transcript_18795:135-659(+)|eukprot:CAMPEP_0181042320 /NCGR_PEP_ID=MMETSP1070-20121207/12086_1 /TAXON_ID=265543 /ORGANISM="Minutocellus polymorphus, Strain NH13" /LENGTH=174 /DNA_ID=CAMNT_0023120523 /DNA_START=121 /DNA_END=645 /DNA_ORIENTATION=-